MNFEWTDEAVETLRTLWAEGKSATEICKIIGAVSRSAVIGKLHRLKVYRDGPPVRGARKQRCTRSNERRAAYQAEWKRRHRAEEKLAREGKPKPTTFVHTVNLQNKRESRKSDPGLPKITPALEVPVSKRLTILELRDETKHAVGTCKYPVDGDMPPYTYCGNDAERNRPYCAYHCAIAYRLGTQREVDRIASRAMGGITGEGKSTIMET